MKRMVLLATIVSSYALYGYETPQKIKDRYQVLYDSQIHSHPDGSKSFHDAKLFRRQGIYVLSLKGDPFEMAFQHGRLLKSEIAKGALPQVAKMVENSVRMAFPNIPIVTDLVIKYLQLTYTEGIVNYGIDLLGGDVDKALLEAYGLSEGSAVPLNDVIYGAFGPESLQVILGKQLSGTLLFSFGTPTGVMLKQCTDFAVRGSYTENREMIIGRNTDYPLNGGFDRFPTVIYYHPTDGTQNYMAVSSAGIHSAGVIGYNQSGLFIGVHTIPTLEVSEKGNSIFLVGQEVMKRARTFDEAINIFKSYRSAAGWTYTLVSTKENRIGSVEITNKRVTVLEEPADLHVQTNHFLSLDMASANLDLNASVNEDTRARKMRAENLAERRKGFFNVQDAVNILSDKWDPINHEVRGLGNVVAVHTTLSSAVFDPSRGRVFVANGRAPVSLTPYVELPLIEEFDADSFGGGDFSVFENSAHVHLYPEIAQAEQLYIEAKTAFESELNPKKAHAILNQVTTLDPKNAAYRFVEGIMALKSNNFKAAMKSFTQCEKMGSEHHRLLGHYYLGRIYADQGNRTKARLKLEEVLSQANPLVEKPLVKAAKTALSKNKNAVPYQLNTETLAIFMPEADMVQY